MRKGLFISIFFALVCFSSKINAQPPGGDGPGADPGCFPPPCIPIDGGLSWLLIAGTVYGGKKVYDFNKDSEDQ